MAGKINQISQTKLFISDQFGVSDITQLEKYDIKHVFNVSSSQLKKYPNIEYYDFPILDEDDQDILQYFDNIFNKIDEIFLQNQNIVINCYAGVSRSASFVIGYLIKTGLPYKDSYSLLKSHRPMINPNKGFVKQLKRYEIICKENTENKE
jgi:protein-tyrosine phosphatase